MANLKAIVLNAVKSISRVVDDIEVTLNYSQVTNSTYDASTGTNSDTVIVTVLTGIEIAMTEDEFEYMTDPKTVKKIMIPGAEINFDPDVKDYAIIAGVRWNTRKWRRKIAGSSYIFWMQEA